jgi:hypothetical protein
MRMERPEQLSCPREFLRNHPFLSLGGSFFQIHPGWMDGNRRGKVSIKVHLHDRVRRGN